MLPAQVSAVVALGLEQLLVQGGLFVSVLMMMMPKHCSAGWRKVSLRPRQPLRTLMVVLVVQRADQL
jgi:hypothetical protein